MVPGTPIAGIPLRDSACAPRKLPSPPHTIRPSSPMYCALSAACCRPSSVSISRQRAVYSMVPPFEMMPSTLRAPNSTMSPLISPRYPRRMPRQEMPYAAVVRTTARTTAFMPGASPPLVRTPILLICFAMMCFLRSCLLCRALSHTAAQKVFQLTRIK